MTNLNPGAVATLDIIRDGQPDDRSRSRWASVLLTSTAWVKVAEPFSRAPSAASGCRTLRRPIRDQFGLPANVNGVIIAQLDPDSPAAQYGLQEGDVIESINRQAVRNVGRLQSPGARKRKARRCCASIVRVNGAYIVISPDGGDGGDGQ